MAPISVTLTMLRRWPRCSGVARHQHQAAALRGTTSAARVSRLSDRLCATEASVRVEHGATTMPHWNEPLAMLAPHVAGVVRLVRQRLDGGALQAQLMAQGAPINVGHHQVGFGARAFAQHLQQAHP